MSELSIVSSLREKRLEVTEILEGLERQANARRADLAHLDATIRLFDPNDILVAARPARRRRYNDWFRPGEWRRKIHDVLRDATEPMATREIVEDIMAARHLSSDDALHLIAIGEGAEILAPRRFLRISSEIGARDVVIMPQFAAAHPRKIVLRTVGAAPSTL